MREVDGTGLCGAGEGNVRGGKEETSEAITGFLLSRKLLQLHKICIEQGFGGRMG